MSAYFHVAYDPVVFYGWVVGEAMRGARSVFFCLLFLFTLYVFWILCACTCMSLINSEKQGKKTENASHRWLA